VRLWIDGDRREIPARASNAHELTDLFYALHLRPGHMVSEIKVDGTRVALDDDTPWHGADDPIIEIRSLAGVDALAEARAEAGARAGELIGDLRSAAERFRLATEAEAHVAFLDCAQRLSHLVNLVENMRFLAIGLGLPAQLREDVLSMDAMRAVIEAMVAAQEDSDWIQLADLIEYELTPVLSSWIGALGERPGAESHNPNAPL
jgi:hypothetical protein